VSAEGAISVPFDILNTTEVDALDGEVLLAICQACKFVKGLFSEFFPRRLCIKPYNVIVPNGYANVSMGIT
jgi:hypothetical protein